MFGINPDEEKAAYWSDLEAAFAAGIDGKWEGSVSMGGGGPPMDLSFNFKTDGDNLTGTTTVFGGQIIRIKDGKIEGNNISFTVNSSFGGMKSTTNYTGTFYGDTQQLTYTTEMSGGKGFQGSHKIRETTMGEDFPPVTFTAKRVE